MPDNPMEELQKFEKSAENAMKGGGLEGLMNEIQGLMKNPEFLKSISKLGEFSQEAFKSLQFEFNKDKIVKDANGNLQAIEFSPPMKDTRSA